MNRENWEKTLPIIQQFVERVPLQLLTRDNVWIDINPDTTAMFEDPTKWRRKREPGDVLTCDEASTRHKQDDIIQYYDPETDSWIIPNATTHEWSPKRKYRLFVHPNGEISATEAKRRHAAGATIQLFSNISKAWEDVPGDYRYWQPDTRYRLKPKAKLRSWAQNEVPIGSAIRMRRDPFNISIIFGCSISDLFIGHLRLTYQDALDQAEWRASPETAWRPCGVEA